VVDTYCGRLISLAFATSALLPSNEHTTIVVDLPKKLTVPDNRPVPLPPNGIAEGPRTMELAIDRPDRRNFVVTLVVSGVEISGSPD